MKRSIQLLSGLFLLIVAGLFFAKYQLKLQYDEIDTTDVYYNYDKTSNLQFAHVKIEGGNQTHVYIEPATDNQLYIQKQYAEAVTFENQADTLIIRFKESYTASENFENYWGTRGSAAVILQYNKLESIVTHDASVSVELLDRSKFKTKISGISNLELINEDLVLSDLRLESFDYSKHRINREGSLKEIAFLSLDLEDHSLCELYNLNADSTVLNLASNSRISADAIFLNK